MLVLVSNRLGLKKMQNEYMEAVRSFCMNRLNCGIIGGRPKEAFYLVGMQESNMIILDPHNTAPALANETVVLQRNHIEMHERTAKKIAFDRLDPSMTFAFYLKSSKDLANFKIWQE